MMAHDFDKIIERRGSHCMKWDSDPKAIAGVTYPVGSPLPLWVADMDFEAPPAVTQALIERARHGIFGYPLVPGSCYDAIIEWVRRRHGWSVAKEWIRFTPGAVPAAHMAVQAFCQPGDAVIIQTPVYYPFYSTIKDNGCHVVSSPLLLRGDRYEMDFEDLERKAADPRATLLILCSPHNPVGRVWTREELSRVGEICARHRVRVVADELHCDIVMPGHAHVPFASIDASCRDMSLTTIAPSKTFNLAGLEATIVIVPDEEMRQRFDNVLARNSISRPNVFAITGMEAAYAHGEAWLDDLLIYLKGNYDLLVEAMGERLPRAKVMPMEGTYLAWMDFRALESDPMRLQERMLTKAEVWLDEGWIFGPEGAGFERMVLACPRSIIADAVDRIARSFA